MFNRRKLFAIFASAPAVVKAVEAAPVKVVPEPVMYVSCGSNVTLTLPAFKSESKLEFKRCGG